MPPTRRTNSTPQPKGRRPKIAGQQSPRRTSPDPASPRADRAAAEAVATEAVSSEVGGTEAGGTGDTASSAPVAAASSRPVNRTGALRPRNRSAGDEALTDVSDDPAAARAGWRRVVVLGVVALALATFAVVAAFRPGADVPNRAWVDTTATTQVTAAARNAVQTLYSYKFDTVDQDFDNARGVLADSMRAEFDKTAQVTRDAVIQTKTATNAEVTDIGVKLLSDDRAELVASMNVSASNDGVAQGSAEGPLSVTMSKVGDTWLLSDIRDR